MKDFKNANKYLDLANKIKFKLYGEKEGSKARNISNLYQDSNGTIWILDEIDVIFIHS